MINTKLSPEAFDKIYRLAAKLKMKPYEMLQMCADTLIRYMDDRYNLTPEMEKLMAVFEDMTGWRQAFNLADPFAKPQIEESTYFLGSKGKKGVRAVHVERPFFGNFKQTSNVPQIVDRTLELIVPNLYRRLRLICVEYECHSVLELLQTMIDEQNITDRNHEEVRKQFEDCNRADNGKPVEYGARTKKGRHYDTENMPTLNFDIHNDPIGY